MPPPLVDPETEQKVWKAVSANPDCSAPALAKKLDGVSPREMVDALNGLLAKSLVKAYKSSDGGLLWKAVNKADAKVKNAMAADERMVYSAIEASGNQGVWSRSIQSSTNLPQAVITKLLTKLQNSKQIKMVKSVKNPTRKMYMLSHIEPSVELTGGPWYTDFELDVEFIKTIRNACLKYIQTQSFPDPDDTSPTAALYTSGGSSKTSQLYPTTTDVAKWLRKSRITETELAPTHVQEILDLLVYDGEVEKLPAFSAAGGDSNKKDGGSEDEGNDEKKKKKKADKKGKGKSSTVGKKRKRKVSSADEEEESDSSVAAVRSKREKRRKKVELKDQSSDEEGSKRSRSKKRNLSKAKDDSDSESESEGSEDDDTTRRKRSSSSLKNKKSSRSKSALSGDETVASSDSQSSSSSSGNSSEEDSKRRSKSSSSKSAKAKSKGEKKKKRKGSDDDSEASDVDFDLAFGHIFGGDSVYRAVRQERSVGLGWSQQAPCGKCPQADFCEDDGPVNPKGCKYYTDWLLQAIEEW